MAVQAGVGGAVVPNRPSQKARWMRHRRCLSPLDTALDVVVGAILIKLLGWHWAFLPTFAAELVPGLDLLPTWTAAVFFATRQLNSAPDEPEAIDRDRPRTTEPEILDPGPAPARRG